MRMFQPQLESLRDATVKDGNISMLSAEGASNAIGSTPEYKFTS